MKRALLFLVLLGCSAVETGNPSATDSALIATSGNPKVGFTNSAALRVDAVWVSLPSFAFIRNEGCGTARESRATFDVGAPVDLLSIPVVNLQTGPDRYCAVELPFAVPSMLPEGAPEELLEATYVILGERTSDGAPVRIAINDTNVVRLEVDTPGEAFVLEGNYALAWDVGRLALVDIDDVPASDDGVVRIDDETNADFLEQLLGLGDQVVSFHIDENGNRVLDGDEGLPLAKVPE